MRDLCGAAPWAIFEYGPDFVPVLEYAGQPASFRMRVALCGSNPQIELIEPLAGPSIYHDWLEAHPVGFHHFGFKVPDIDDAISAMANAGFSTTQQGRDYGLGGGGAFAYFDTLDRFGYISEAIVVPPKRHDPLEVWPTP